MFRTSHTVQILKPFKVVLFFFLLLWLANKVAAGIQSGSMTIVYPVMGLSILSVVLWFVEKKGVFPLLCGLVLIYWVPFETLSHWFTALLDNLYLTELGIWTLFIGILVYNSVSPSARLSSTVRRFPLLPFMLFIGGALLTHLAAEGFSSHSAVKIRTLCLLPAGICFLCMYLIRTLKQAEKLLWIFLISAGLMGLVYLYAPQQLNAAILQDFGTNYLSVLGCHRLWKIIKLPFFGVLNFNPETTSICFAYITVLAFSLWLSAPAGRMRLLSFAVMIISGYAIIEAQGRTGFVAAEFSMLIIAALPFLARKKGSSFFGGIALSKSLTVLPVFFGIWLYTSIQKDLFTRSMTLFIDPLQTPGLERRLTRMNDSLSVLFDHPILGVGLEGFPEYLYITPWYAHNLYLYLWLSFGAIGFLGFLWIFVRYTKACWSGLYSDNRNLQILCSAGIGCTSVLAVAGTASCIFSSSIEILTVWIPVGIIMAAVTLKDEELKINE